MSIASIREKFGERLSSKFSSEFNSEDQIIEQKFIESKIF
ncbi:unnamed protein product [Brugia timori]|uniref:Lipopolysaccharide biosynthesis protein n=1 Tax=Brugia timori TaxID=42155 RepID=A0A0R3R6C2_9BILA|nr:unnamed protein product [Brugia timori]